MIELSAFFIFCPCDADALDHNDDFFCYDRMMVYSDTLTKNPRFGIPQTLTYQGNIYGNF